MINIKNHLFFLTRQKVHRSTDQAIMPRGIRFKAQIMHVAMAGFKTNYIFCI